MELRELEDIDKEHKNADYKRNLNNQHRLFFGEARQLVTEYLRGLGIGNANQEPLELGWLQEVLRTKAVTYASKPVRRLKDAKESDDAQTVVTGTLERMGFDAFLRELDVRVTLWRTAIVRFYPSDASGGVVPRMFSPMQILRAPSVHEPERLDQDRAWALKLANDTIEMWEPRGDRWTMRMVNDRGERLQEQPFSATGTISPYPVLPAHLVFDGFSDRAYLPVPSHRTSYPLALASCVALIMEALVATSGPEVEYEQRGEAGAEEVGPEQMPEEFGPGTRRLLPGGVTSKVLALNPQVGGAVKTIETLQFAFLRAEGIDPGLFRQSQSVSAAAIRVLQRPLRELQESRKPWALQAEARHWDALRSVHNVHAQTWGVDRLPDGGIETQLAQLDVPMEPKEISEAMNLSRASGTRSIIDHIMADWNVGRDEAIGIYERVIRDRQTYPVEVDGQQLASAASGPNPANPEPEDINPAASVLDAVRAVS